MQEWIWHGRRNICCLSGRTAPHGRNRWSAGCSEFRRQYVIFREMSFNSPFPAVGLFRRVFSPGTSLPEQRCGIPRRLPPSSRFTCRFLLLPENPSPFLRSSGWNRPDVCGISGSGGSSESLDRREMPLFFSLFPFFRCFFVEKCHETCIFRKCRYGNRFLH